MKKGFRKTSASFRKSHAPHRLETGFSMLEAVVVVGVLLALAVSGFFAYGPITQNAKMAKVKSAASEVLTAAQVASFDGYADSTPQDVVDKWNSSTDQISMKLLEPTAGSTSANGDLCIQATNVSNPEITTQAGTCSNVTSGSGSSGTGLSPDKTSNPASPPAVMVSTWDTSIIPLYATNDCSTITLPLTGAVDATINWGDGTPAEHFNREFPSHPYTDTPGVKTIRIDGTFTGWVGESWTSDWSQECITQVTEWGETGTTDVVAGFYDAINVTSVARIPSTATDWQYLFTSTKINNDLSGWDTSKVTNMTGTFNYAEQFNQPLNSWNTSSVVYMGAMFAHADEFNQPLNSWDTSKVVDMDNMFLQAKKFNQPLDRWNTSSVTDMSGMFLLAEKFNQPLNTWDTSKVTLMGETFYLAADFNQPLNNWNVSNVVEIRNMFNSATSFSQDISGWKFEKFLERTTGFTDNSGLTPDQIPQYVANPCPWWCSSSTTTG